MKKSAYEPAPRLPVKLDRAINGEFAPTLLGPGVPGCGHRAPQPPSATIVLAFMVPLVAGCATLMRVPARGTLAGETMDTTVDSAAARCLLDVQVDADAHQAAARCGLDGIFARYNGMPLTRGTLTALVD